MEKSAAGTLPEDVVLEILARVTNPIALFRCGTACRRWCALVTDPSFLNRRWPKNAPDRSFLVGFFLQLQSVGERIAGVLSFLPAPASPLGPPHPFLRSHFPVLYGGGGGDFPDHVPLASRHGHLVVRLRLLPPRGPEQSSVQLAVYDMFAGAYHVLPRLECDRFSSIACSAILTSADIQQQQQTPSSSLPYHSPFFRVIIFETVDLRRYNLYSFSSGEARWSTPTHCRNNPERRVFTMQMPLGTVVCQGSAHWLFLDMSNFYTLSVSLDTHQFSFVKVPLSVQPNTCPASRLCVGTDGRLTLLALNTQSHQLEIWTKENDGLPRFDDTTRWLCTQVIHIEKPKGNQIGTVIWMYLGERIGTSLMLAKYSATFMVDLETRTISEQVTGQFCSLPYIGSVPFEMDWPTFFTSRLGKLRRRNISNHMDLLGD